MRPSDLDVVTETGHYKPNAISLDDFIVEGEKRYWLHPPSLKLRRAGPLSFRPTPKLRRCKSAFLSAVADFGVAGIAIDRFDGTIVGQQLEEVTE